MTTIVQSNVEDWIGKSLVTKYDDKLQVAKVGVFKTKVLNEYKNTEVSQFKIVDETSTQVSTKTAGGTIGGAVVGGLLLGGVGAVVGGIAGGNKIESTSSVKIAFKFDDKNWIIVEYNTNEKELAGRLMKLAVKNLTKRFASNLHSPFE